MGRSKSFEPNKKLFRAMELFWYKGYENTSMSDLKKHLGLSTQSIYDTFGGKENLYLQTLELFYGNSVEGLKLTLRSKEDASLPEIKLHFLLAYRMQIGDKTKASCYIANTSLELGLLNKEAQIQSIKFFSMLKDAFKFALSNAIAKNEIPDDRDPEQLAWYLTNSISGLGVLNRAGADVGNILNIINTTLTTLDPQHSNFDKKTIKKAEETERLINNMMKEIFE
ncbi:MAG: HTH-type transcriptional repressor ComR [Candidatus Heimdallarchaeota archaeon LC_2]|nr:MAG: HTH-type transcriptional repressor ComR [Candidatus Heimdallarchaeota archaeon LC_2]